jgi:hypothetical protein
MNINQDTVVTVKLTAGEIQAASFMLNEAVKAKGMEVAAAAVVISSKLQDAIKSLQEVPEANDVAKKEGPKVVPK